jgi:hypothetical protein
MKDKLLADILYMEVGWIEEESFRIEVVEVCKKYE